MRLQPTQYSFTVPSRYLHVNPGPGKTLLVFVHGYSDSAPSFVRRAFPEMDARFEIFAPNGPFPLPQRVENEWKEAFGWYFADFSRGQIHIHPDVAAIAVSSLVNSLGLADRPKVLCGFSQGGYFLPHLAHRLENVRSFVTIGAGFHPEFFAEFGLRLPVTAIHGTDDEIIPFAAGKADFDRLGEWNSGGEFLAVPGMTHTINAEGRAVLRKVLEALPG